MAIKVETLDGAPERMVAVACVVNKAVLGQVVAMWSATALPSRWANLVVGWAVDYYREWKRPPGVDIAVQFDAWRVGAGDPATVELVGKFLQTISDEYRKLKERINPEYVLKVAAGLMHRVRLVETNNRLSAFIEAGELDKAAAEFAKYRPVELGSSGWLDLGDIPSLAALVASTRASREKPLIEFPDALGIFYGRTFERDSFVSFLAPKKGCKSFFMQSLAWRAFRQGRKVAYFDAGDMTKGQIVVDRLSCLAAGRPLLGSKVSAFRIPVKMESPSAEGQRPEITQKRVWYKADMTDAQVVDALSQLSVTRQSGFRLSPHPNSTLSVAGIEAQLEQWARDDYIADVIFIDYCDIMAPVDRRLEGLDRINETWKALRGLSQKQNCLVVTATQARRDSHTKFLMDQEDVSDETRKLAHVTAMIGINRGKTDVDEGTFRLNYIAGRNTELSASECVWTAGHLAFADPCMVSTF